MVFYWVSHGLAAGFRRFPTGFWRFPISNGFRAVSYRFLIGFWRLPMVSYGFPRGFFWLLMGFGRFPMVSYGPMGFQRLLAVSLWVSHSFAEGFPWLPLGFPEVSGGCPWFPMGFPKVSCGFPWVYTSFAPAIPISCGSYHCGEVCVDLKTLTSLGSRSDLTLRASQVCRQRRSDRPSIYVNSDKHTQARVVGPISNGLQPCLSVCARQLWLQNGLVPRCLQLFTFALMA